MPSVTHTAACSGFRPVANASGWATGLTYSQGSGRPRVPTSSRTMAYSHGASASETGCAPIARSASLSDQK
jgi:hypothetical protein